MPLDKTNLLLTSLRSTDFRAAEMAFAQWLASGAPLDGIGALASREARRAGFLLDQSMRLGLLPRGRYQEFVEHLRRQADLPSADTTDVDLAKRWQTDRVFDPGRIRQRLREIALIRSHGIEDRSLEDAGIQNPPTTGLMAPGSQPQT